MLALSVSSWDTVDTQLHLPYGSPVKYSLAWPIQELSSVFSFSPRCRSCRVHSLTFLAQRKTSARRCPSYRRTLPDMVAMQAGLSLLDTHRGRTYQHFTCSPPGAVLNARVQFQERWSSATQAGLKGWSGEVVAWCGASSGYRECMT